MNMMFGSGGGVSFVTHLKLKLETEAKPQGDDSLWQSCYFSQRSTPILRFRVQIKASYLPQLLQTKKGLDRR
jgi:hypothetical protein